MISNYSEEVFKPNILYAIVRDSYEQACDDRTNVNAWQNMFGKGDFIYCKRLQSSKDIPKTNCPFGFGTRLLTVVTDPLTTENDLEMICRLFASKYDAGSIGLPGNKVIKLK